MKKLLLLLIISSCCFYSCTKKCGHCSVIEYEPDGVTFKTETPLGEYCGSDVRVQAGKDATDMGISCTNCQIDCL